DIDRKPRRDRRRERPRIHHRRMVGGLPPHPRLLHHILGLGRTTEHPIRDPEQTRPQTDEDRSSLIERTRVSHSPHPNTPPPPPLRSAYKGSVVARSPAPSARIRRLASRADARPHPDVPP